MPVLHQEEGDGNEEYRTQVGHGAHEQLVDETEHEPRQGHHQGE